MGWRWLHAPLLWMASLEPTVVLEESVQNDTNRADDSQYREVAVSPAKFWHVLEVHAVDACNGRGHKGYCRPGGDLAQFLVLANGDRILADTDESEVRLQYVSEQTVDGRYGVSPPKLPSPRHNPTVALTIDTEVHPPKILLIRGPAELDVVDGIPEEYLASEGVVDWGSICAAVRMLWPAAPRSDKALTPQKERGHQRASRRTPHRCCYAMALPRRYSPESNRSVATKLGPSDRRGGGRRRARTTSSLPHRTADRRGSAIGASGCSTLMRRRRAERSLSAPPAPHRCVTRHRIWRQCEGGSAHAWPRFGRDDSRCLRGPLRG